MFSFLPSNIQYAMERYMGARQGDSSGDEQGTSSDSSEDECDGVSGMVAKAVRIRRKVALLDSLKTLSLGALIAYQPFIALSKKQRSFYKRVGKKFFYNLTTILGHIASI
jgi:hypothetical protein